MNAGVCLLYLLSCCDFNEMHPTVTHENSSSSSNSVTRQAKIHFKNKDRIFQKSCYYKLGRVLSGQCPYTALKRCVRADEGGETMSC